MAARFLISAFFAAALSAQSLDRTFYVASAPSPDDLQSIVNVLRSVGDIQHISMDFSQKAISVSGAAGQVAFADWLCHEIDKPAIGQPPREYRLPDSEPPLVRVYYLAHVKTPQNLQEIANALRSITGIQRLFPYYRLNALVMRGSAAEIATADWLLHELDRDSPAQTSPDLPMPGADGQVVKVFALQNAGTPQALQEIVNVTRSLADIQRFFPYNARGSILARGSAEQIAVAAWLVQAFDQPPADRAVHEYRASGLNPVVRVVYLTHPQSPDSMRDIVNFVRSSTHMQRAFPSTVRNAVGMRGTADQISRAAQLIEERDR